MKNVSSMKKILGLQSQQIGRLILFFVLSYCSTAFAQTNVTVTITDSSSSPQSGLNIYAFDGGSYSGTSAVTDTNGVAQLNLADGDYRFRVDKSSTQFFTNTVNHCTTPNCSSFNYQIPEDITVSVLSSSGSPEVGLNVYAFDGTTYAGKTGITDSNGELSFTLLPGNYRFRVDKNGTQYYSATTNHCSAPGCTAVNVEIPENTQVTVTSAGGGVETGLTVYAFNGTTYANKSAVTDVNGVATFTLLAGDYRFRIDKNGTQYYTAGTNHCTLPGCTTASYAIPEDITVSVLSSSGSPEVGINVYAYDGTTYTGKTGVTDSNGELSFTLLPGNYRFRADKNGTQYYSDTTNHCSAPGCATASVEIPENTQVTVTSAGGGAEAGLTVYAFNGTSYANKSAVTDVNGVATFTLLAGDYRFRIDKNGTQYYTAGTNHCTLPGCTTASYAIPEDITVSVLSSSGSPEVGLNVYAYDGTTYAGKTGVTDSNGELSFTLLPGNYRFRADKNGTQYYSATANHCSAPGCTTASVEIPENTQVTVTSAGGGAEAGLTVYAFNGTTYANKSAVTDVNGVATFTLLAGDYRFRIDKSGTQYYTAETNHCTLPGCTTASYAIPEDITVSVLSSSGSPEIGISVYAYDGTTYAGKTGVTDSNGELSFTLLPGNYRFRADKNGTQYYSSTTNHCSAPGCTAVSVDIPENVIVTVSSTAGLEAGLTVYAFDGTTYAGKSAVTDTNGNAEFTLLPGNYRFRIDKNGTQYFTNTANHCSVPGCTEVSHNVPSPIPGISINTPEDGAIILDTELPLLITATAIDLEDGDLSSTITFSSDIDGAITSTAVLSLGAHTITASVIDSDLNTNSTSITVIIEQAFFPVVLDPTITSNSSSFIIETDELTATRTASGWDRVFGNLARNSGQYAFEYTNIDTSSSSTILGIAPINGMVGTYIGKHADEYSYRGDGSAYSSGVRVDGAAIFPKTRKGNKAILLVDFDARTIRVRVEGEEQSVELYNNFSVASAGMYPGISLKNANSKVVANFDGPFNLPLDEGYVPWGSQYSSEAYPVVSFVSPQETEDFLYSDSITFTYTAVDPEDGDITNSVILESSQDGFFNSPSTFSAGYHTITATVTDSDGNTSRSFLEILVQPEFTTLDLSLNNQTEITLSNGDLQARNFTNDVQAIVTAYANSTRKTGKYVFQYTPVSLIFGSSAAASVGLVPADANSPDGFADISGAYAYQGSRARIDGSDSGNSVTADATLPSTSDGEPLLFMVDLDEGTIRVKGSEDAFSKPLFESANLSELGMRPAIQLYRKSSALMNFSGPFDIVPDPGYLPWGSNDAPSSVPTVSFSSPANDLYILDSELPFLLTATATDAEEGDLSASISYSSSLDGSFTDTSSLSPGVHVITATVTDNEGYIGGDSIIVTIDSQVDVLIDLNHNDLGALDLFGENNLSAQYNASGSDWEDFYANKIRKTGKYAFQYTHLVGAAGTSSIGIVPGSAAINNYIGARYNTFGYRNDGKKAESGNVTSIGSPVTTVGESLIFMVDLDTGSIRVRGVGDTASKEIFSGLTFPEEGMRPGFALSALGARLSINLAGPFEIPLDSGFRPWQSTINSVPQLELSSPGTEFMEAELIAFNGDVTDPEQGNINDAIEWSSNIDGVLGIGSSIQVALSAGNHIITGTVNDGFDQSTAILNIAVFAVADTLPLVLITSPGDGYSAGEGQNITFTATANDTEDGDLSATISWNSDNDGNLGTGANITLSTLSAGLHVIAASSTDSNGGTSIDRMTVYVGTPTSLQEYSHNAFGQRVIKADVATSTAIHFIYDQSGRVIAEIDSATGNTLREYIYVNGQQVAMVDDTQTVNEEIYFIHNDHLGTPQKITDSSQIIAWAADYEPFGKATLTTNIIENNIRFPGQYFDGETDLHQNGFRPYDSSTGRYTQSDPIGLRGGLNTYGYVSGNPLINYDPYGLAVWGISFGGGATFFGGAGGKSTTIAFDSSGSFSIVTTTEAGKGDKKGGSLFVRGLYGGGASKVKNLEGFGGSFSMTTPGVSISFTLPYSSECGIGERILEFGWGLGRDASFTVSEGRSVYKTDIFGRVGRSISRMFFKF